VSGQNTWNRTGSLQRSDKRKRCNTEPVHKKNEAEDCGKENAYPSSNVGGRLERHQSMPSLQPFCPITVKCTREIAGFNTLSDALKRLDFISAVHDVRRFHYVSSLLRLLLKQERLFRLPGSCQVLVFRILEEMARTVYTERRGEPVLKKLLQDLLVAMDERPVWGSKHGSETLNRAFERARRRIACITAMEMKQSQMEARQESINMEDKEQDTEIENLPEECIREILLRLSDSGDLERAGEVMPTMSMIVKERRLWRELVQAHFTNLQIEFILSREPELKDKKLYKDMYYALKKQFGLREEYTDMLEMCRTCRVLYWQGLGHPCLLKSNYSDKPGGQVPITPSRFLTFFSI
jgi:F-box protein 25/32